MTPEAAASLRIHEDQFVDMVAPGLHGLADAIPESTSVERLASAPLDRPRSAGLLWRESLHRRLLGIADVTSVAVAAGLVLGAFDQGRAALSALVGAVLVLFVFKLAAGELRRLGELVVNEREAELPSKPRVGIQASAEVDGLRTRPKGRARFGECAHAALESVRE
jgi:hypothetical protein